MPDIAIDRLVPHPGNANQMAAADLDKLGAHIARSGRYPALIVRPHPARADHYELLDGHHRLLALRRLGHTQAVCDIWEADDEQAAMLLLTLNRLRGRDDPYLRGALLDRLADSLDMKDLLRLVPDDAARVQRLIESNHPPAPESLAPPEDPHLMPQAVTFFLTGPQRERLLAKLRAIARDRSAALIAALDLDAADDQPEAAASTP
jgi:ParB family chromosome partitioning protein